MSASEPRPRRRRGGLDVALYVFARARGASMAEAAAAAGSRGRSARARSSAGYRLEAKPEVVELLDQARAEIRPQLEKMWDDGLRWAAGVLSGHLEATNLDKHHAMSLVGRALGRFEDRSHVTVTHRLAYESVLPSGGVIRPGEQLPPHKPTQLLEQEGTTDDGGAADEER